VPQNATINTKTHKEIFSTERYDCFMFKITTAFPKMGSFFLTKKISVKRESGGTKYESCSSWRHGLVGSKMLQVLAERISG